MPQTTPPGKGRERRQKPRLSLTRSLIARYGAQGVVIVDIHDLGARIEHFAPLTRGKSATLVFDWQSTRIEIAASVVWLALDAPAYMTAARLNVSGGLDKD